ncbi:hypothetical protein PR003_g11465 [Phytophthora rubi]|uniref:Uncharacterized protein n=1 Tax=Phytophthora rubi TaxID=129364 RepID=A0A6A3MIB8_9STRA|nr:hypothetical protein PR001_g10673 [Phytophthora rubi]KAE9338516.1 hypothetical protein PR003_g11465 [Phytophthora rubi]
MVDTLAYMAIHSRTSKQVQIEENMSKGGCWEQVFKHMQEDLAPWFETKEKAAQRDVVADCQ